MPKKPKSHAQRMREREKENGTYQKKYNAGWKSSAKQGYDHKWRKFRQAFLSQNPLCAHCLEKGLTVEAVVVDHVIPHRGDKNLFYNNEFQALCVSCHNIKTNKGGQK